MLYLRIHVFVEERSAACFAQWLWERRWASGDER